MLSGRLEADPFKDDCYKMKILLEYKTAPSYKKLRMPTTPNIFSMSDMFPRQLYHKKKN